MRYQLIQSAILSTALVGSLSLALGEVDGLVLCFGCDGHVEVELAGHECCGEACASVDSVEPEATEPAHHDCVDIPLAGQKSGLSATSPGKLKNEQHPRHVRAADAFAPLHEGSSWEWLTAQSPPPYPSLTSLRTTILLV